MPFLPIHDDNPRQWISTPYVGWAIILFCTVLYIWQASLSGREEGAFIFSYGFIPAVFFEHRELADHLIEIPAALTALTSVFLHGGVWHLVGNMLYLYIFGDNVEDACGHWRFVVFFVLCGVIATLTHGYIYERETIPLIGASGAISGILGAYVVLRPFAKITALMPFFIPVKLPVWLWVGGWFAFQTIAGGGMLGEDNVAYWAHIGGFVAGVLLIPLMKRDEARLFAR